MTAFKVTLTTDEQTRLGAAAWSQFARMPSSNPGDIANALVPAVESIVAARAAGALREAATEAERDAVTCPAGCTSETCKGHNLTTARWLRALANEYDAP